MLEVEKALNKFAKGVVRTSESNLIRQGKRASGSLYNSLDHALEVFPNSFSLSFEMNKYTTLKPPVKGLKEWSYLKGLNPFAVRESIFKKGIKPSLFFTKAFEHHFSKLPKELEEAFALDIESFIEFTTRK